jgi:hypothetical protein
VGFIVEVENLEILPEMKIRLRIWLKGMYFCGEEGRNMTKE